MSKHWSNRQGARMLRFAIVHNVLRQGLIDEADAKELLSGCLTPGDERTRVDDSGLLSMTFNEAEAATKDDHAGKGEG